MTGGAADGVVGGAADGVVGGMADGVRIPGAGGFVISTPV